MKFNEQEYLEEMSGLIATATAKMSKEHPNLVIYTINIWTDPDAAVSAVNFDTFENSVSQVEALNAFCKKTLRPIYVGRR